MISKRESRSNADDKPDEHRSARVSTYSPSNSVSRDRELETLWLRIDQPFVATVLVPVRPVKGDEVLDLAKRLARSGAVIEDREVALADFRGVSPHAADRTRTVIDRMAAAGPLLLVVDPLTEQHGGIPVVESSGRALLVIRLGSSTAGSITATQALIPSTCDTAVVCLAKRQSSARPAGRDTRGDSRPASTPPAARPTAIEEPASTQPNRQRGPAQSNKSRNPQSAHKQRSSTPPQGKADES